MGAVYRARQTKLGRDVAVKVLLSDNNDLLMAERFYREGHALARLNHPNIVAVHDIGWTEDFAYLVMELVEGKTLRELITRGKLSTERTLLIATQACAALAFAHRRGIVHRDIKPENVLVERSSNVKIADFGIVKFTQGDDAYRTTLTESCVHLGSPPYMSPEQRTENGNVDARTDVYAIGVVLYEMLTGELPERDFVPPSRKSNCGRQLDGIVRRCIRSDPADRFQSAADVYDQLQRFSKRQRIIGHAAICGALAGLALVVTVFFAFALRPDPGDAHALSTRPRKTGDRERVMPSNGVRESTLTAKDARHVREVEFTLSERSPVFGDVDDIGLVDLDRDGYVDVVCCGGDSQLNAVWMNDRTGGFVKNKDAYAGEGATDVAFAFLDDDPYVDMVSLGGGKISILHGTGRRGFRDGVVLRATASTSLALGDLDGDSDVDLVVARGGRTESANRVYLNVGSGVFEGAAQEIGDSTSVDVALADLNGDGALDLFVVNGEAPDRIWLNDGSGAFHDSGQALTARDINGQSAASSAVALKDIDRDGDIDGFVVVKAQPSVVWKNDGTGRMSMHERVGDSFRSTSVAMDDVNGDGYPDAIVGNFIQASNFQGAPNRIYLGDGSGSFSRLNFDFGRSYTHSVGLADLDNDGDLDIIFGHANDDPTTVWLNQTR